MKKCNIINTLYDTYLNCCNKKLIRLAYIYVLEIKYKGFFKFGCEIAGIELI